METGENRLKDRTPGGSQGTYMDDPAGYIIQYITEGMQ
jgi:hypothetical protein